MNPGMIIVLKGVFFKNVRIFSLYRFLIFNYRLRLNRGDFVVLIFRILISLDLFLCICFHFICIYNYSYFYFYFIIYLQINSQLIYLLFR
jgi:hypothetical protein